MIKLLLLNLEPINYYQTCIQIGEVYHDLLQVEFLEFVYDFRDERNASILLLVLWEFSAPGCRETSFDGGRSGVPPSIKTRLPTI